MTCNDTKHARSVDDYCLLLDHFQTTKFIYYEPQFTNSVLLNVST